MNEKILIVEDDFEIASVIREYLERTGYSTVWASTGKEGINEFNNDNFDLIIVDIMMPEMDGLTLCKNIRIKSEVPILIISAKNKDEDKVKGLNIGADDYLTKPFSLIELEARVRSHLRRYRKYINRNVNGKILEYDGGLKVCKDTESFELKNEKLHLTSKEIALFFLMSQNPNKIFSKAELYESIWGEMDVEGNNTVTVHVKSLREKLKDNIKHPKFIETVWGKGYRFIGDKLE
ncbi:regulatory protein VanR [Gottschalkia purinilytica]|uniref:Regulatory protein VanR n=1 Tax=Gottschalkia purinilytica TaxID=1503 RepID=A0A0L0W9H1_GOTPU|nr:response regulator transcription factor [Gottschalkia purinilytica]KNF08194.1 regulatory protein VanR [Gottschalkia purinilytica]